MSSLPSTILPLICHYLPLHPKVLNVCRLSRAFSPLPPAALAWDHVELTPSLLREFDRCWLAYAVRAGRSCRYSNFQHRIISHIQSPYRSRPNCSHLSELSFSTSAEPIFTAIQEKRQLKEKSSPTDKRSSGISASSNSLASSCPQLTNFSLQSSLVEAQNSIYSPERP